MFDDPLTDGAAKDGDQDAAGDPRGAADGLDRLDVFARLDQARFAVVPPEKSFVIFDQMHEIGRAHV